MTHADHLRPVLGVLLKLASVVLLSSMAACVKWLGDAVPSGQIIFVRGLISIAVLALIAWRVEGLHLLKTLNWRSHALRSVSGTISMFCLFTALTLIPFADVTAITFTAPMFLTLLAMLFLGERIHRYRWTALAIGFAGVVIMVGPYLSFGSGNSLGVVVALAAAVFSALAMMFLRSMSGGGTASGSKSGSGSGSGSGTESEGVDGGERGGSGNSGEHAITITFYFSLTSMVCAAVTALGGWPMPTQRQWLVIVGAGMLGVFGQLLMTLSYRYAEASTIAPLDYANLLVAVLYGYFLFGETPGLSTWLGAPLVVAAGLIILWREYTQLRRRHAPTLVPHGIAPGGSE